MDKNREFHELLGLCWHELNPSGVGFLCTCGRWFEYEDIDNIHMRCHNPDYAADPRLVLREMQKKGSDLYDDFLDSLAPELEHYGYIEAYYILDTTGKLRDAAIKFMRKETADEPT